MAKFKSRYETNSSGSGSYVLRLIIIILLLGMGLRWLARNIDLAKYYDSTPNNLVISDVDSSRYFIPKGSEGQLIHHKFYSLSYNEKYEQADWVAYALSKASLIIPNVPRTNWFESDPQVRTSSAAYEDYRGSGYTRGHLAPAGDMAFSQRAMTESFLMSNISPQDKFFNQGIWRELEENVRDWAFRKGELIIVTGPVFQHKFKKRIGANKVAVPDAFFKVVLDVQKQKAGIAFVIPNKKSTERLHEYAMSIDTLESIVELDFFHDFLQDSVEKEIESSFELRNWPVSEKKYQLRIKEWNRMH